MQSSNSKASSWTTRSVSCKQEAINGSHVTNRNLTCNGELPETGYCSSEEGADENLVYMTCILQGRRLGVAYYDSSTREMYVWEAWEEGEQLQHFPCVQLIKYQVQPAVIYTSTKMDEHFVTALQTKLQGSNDLPKVKLVKSSIFSYQQARHRLAYVRVTGMQNDLNDKERVHVLNSMINIESDMQVRAAGGLLAILQQEMLIDTIQLEECAIEPVQIESISELSLKGFLCMDAATHEALQIFQVDKHASSMGIGKAKEGFSVFGIMNKCVTLMGRRLLRLWFLRPLLDLSVLNDRFESISMFKSSRDLVGTLQASLKRIKDMPRLLKKFFSPSSTATASDWQSLVESISSLLQIRGIFEVATSQRHHNSAALMNLKITEKVFSSVNDELVLANDIINAVIDFDQLSGENSETMIVYGLCDELDELKRLYEGLPDFLNQVTMPELRRLSQEPVCSNNSSIVYMPQVGYFLRFTGHKLDERGLHRCTDLDFAFEGGEADEKAFFYRTSKTRELDNVLGDIYHKILDMEREILRNLESRLESYRSSLNEAARNAAELDWYTRHIELNLLALGIAAHDYDYNRPELTEDAVLTIKNGRHALQEIIVDRFVPNDTDISNRGQISIITGPNYSGKSIYIKQVAIIVFLAHIGSFVPAEQATIGLTDRIFSRVASKETVAVPQSTFMIDLNQIAIMLRHATSRSLCLIDEFGKGTLTADGIGLLCATFNHFATSQSTPKVLACTHFSEVFDETILAKSDKISFSTMSVLEPKSAREQETIDDIIFLYRLVPGHVVPSYGIHCAELAGLASDILQRASEVLEIIRAGNSVDRLNTPKTSSKDKRYHALAARLLAFDCKNGDPTKFLREIFQSNHETSESRKEIC